MEFLIIVSFFEKSKAGIGGQFTNVQNMGDEKYGNATYLRMACFLNCQTKIRNNYVYYTIISGATKIYFRPGG